MPKLLYIISDDNYFLSHRLNLAIAAKADGYDVFVLAFENNAKFTDKIKSHGLGLMANIKNAFYSGDIMKVNTLWFILMFQMWKEKWIF